MGKCRCEWNTATLSLPTTNSREVALEPVDVPPRWGAQSGAGLSLLSTSRPATQFCSDGHWCPGHHGSFSLSIPNSFLPAEVHLCALEGILTEKWRKPDRRHLYPEAAQSARIQALQGEPLSWGTRTSPVTTYLFIPRLHGLAEPGGICQLPELLVHLGEGGRESLLLRGIQLLLQAGREETRPVMRTEEPSRTVPPAGEVCPPCCLSCCRRTHPKARTPSSHLLSPQRTPLNTSNRTESQSTS